MKLLSVLRLPGYLLLLAFNITVNTCYSQFYAPYGGPFTPKGDLRVLIIFAGFEPECDRSDAGFWPNVNRGQGQEDCKTLPIYYRRLFYGDFSEFNEQAGDKSLSNFYYQMSRHHPHNPPLRIVADVFPERINLPGTQPDTRAVFEIIQKKYPQFDWSRYDKRKNPSSFRFDNSSSQPDHVLDYVVVVFRRRGGGGYAGISNYVFTTTAKGKEEKYTVHPSCGFTIITGIPDNECGLKRLFHHELAHTLFNCPHVFGANTVYGNYFYTSTGWGMMAYGVVNCSANAWESWFNGWIELPPERDLSGVQHNGRYRLKDFVTTGDAIRITLPYSGQRLWIENHAGISPLDDRESFYRDGLNDSISPADKGVLMFVENIASDRRQEISPLGLAYANGLKALYAGGNYDYEALGYAPDPRWWGNILVDFNVMGANPSGAHNGITPVRGNFGYDTLFPDKIIYRSFTNNSQEPCSICGEPCKGALSQEAVGVNKKNGMYTYDEIGLHMAFGNQALPQKIGISSNPMIINHQKYLCPDKLEPIYLHGVSVTILSKSESGEVTLEIRFDDTEITGDQRFTGELILNDVPGAAYDLLLKEGATLTIDQSGTPNRYNQGNLVNGVYEFPGFVNPSLLTIEKGARVLVEEGATLRIMEGSTLLVKSGATVIVKGKIKIGKNAFWETEAGAEIKVEGGKISRHKKSFQGVNPKLKMR